jgi:hypothetical protein
MRFVIQHHLEKNEHYDLMVELEKSDKLLTIKISPQDLDLLLKSNKITAERLPGHRKEYLNYEGQVSGGRGTVKIFDSGKCKTVLYSEDRFEFELSGKKIAGKIVISSIDGKMYNCLKSCSE